MNNIYKKNIEIVKQITPALAEWIEKEKAVDWCTIVKNTKGASNLLIKRGAKLELAYNKESPKKDIKKLVKQLNLYKDDITIVIGFGLGYLTHQLLIKAEKTHRIIVVEPIATLFQLAFKHIDFSKYILEGKLTFASPGKKEIAYVIQLLENATIVNNWQILISEYTAKRPEEYSKITNYTIETINQVRCNTGTVMGAGKILADNDINSLPYVIRHRGINELKDLYKDKPAVLVCTGPSLEKNIHRLIPIQDKVIIIAVAQALRILLAYDIKPDFITTVDFGKTNLGHYKGLMDSDVPLVCLNRTYAEILKQYQGPKFIVATPVPGYEKTAAGILTNKGAVDTGGSVAHLSMMFGRLLGCNPLIMLGQDLSLTDKSHNRQADESGTISIDDKTGAIMWNVKDHRSHLKESITKGEYTMGIPIRTPGYLGEMVITNSGLASFILAFRNLIEAYFKNDQFVINCTEGGAKIEGTKQLSFHKAIEKYCQNQIDKSIIKPFLSLADDADELIEKVIPLLEQDLDILNMIEKESKIALETTKKIKKHAKNPYKIKKYIKENETHSLAAQHLAIKIPLVGVAIFNASRTIHNKELKVKGRIHHLLNNKKDLNIRIKRNKFILTAVKKAAVELKKGYKETLNLLKKYQKTKDEKLLNIPDDYIPSLRDAFTFFKEGNFARPLLEARKCIDIGIKSFIVPSEYQDPSNYGSILSNRPVNAKHIEKIAIDLRTKSIKKAIKNYRNIDKLLEYLDLMEENKKIGKEELKKIQKIEALNDPLQKIEKSNHDFGKACELLKKAVELFPEKEHSLWGYATTLHHTNQFEKSIKYYHKLIDKVQNKIDKISFSKKSNTFLENYKEKKEKNTLKIRIITKLFRKKRDYDILTKRILCYKYELGQVILISGQIKEGLSHLKDVMQETNMFDEFFKRIGDLYFEMNDIDKAIEAYNTYLKRFPEDFIVWGKKGDCHRYLRDAYDPKDIEGSLKEDEKAEKAYNKLRRLKPDIVIKDFYILKRKEKQSTSTTAYIPLDTTSTPSKKRKNNEPRE